MKGFERTDILITTQRKLFWQEVLPKENSRGEFFDLWAYIFNCTIE